MPNFRKKSAPFRAIFLILFWTITSELLTDVWSCSPGRSGFRRRRDRKLTPLVFKQHIPNLPENSLMASGPSFGRIHRNDPEFKNLFPNYNPDIVFKDEEGTGEDRIMSKHCKEKVDTLAISVMNQWAGVKLRVTEGWDEEGDHALNSLHYEGRALDITTSDRDTSKYGTLARLAVEAGFDWVYYESRSHIHCSVKTEPSFTTKVSGCFTSESTLNTTEGQKNLKDVKPGDKVFTTTITGETIFSEVITFLHRDPESFASFIFIRTESGSELELTPWHLIFVSDTPDYQKGIHSVFAKDVKPEQFLLVSAFVNNNESAHSIIQYKKISEVKYVIRKGVYAPLTEAGTIVVNNILVSCYAVVREHWIGHLAFYPVRLYFNAKQILVDSLNYNSASVFVEGNTPIWWYAKILYLITSSVNII